MVVPFRGAQYPHRFLATAPRPLRAGHDDGRAGIGDQTAINQMERPGDSALIGAGTWADDATCAVSTTGIGEVFVRGVGAHDVAARMQHGGRPFADACREALDRLVGIGGKETGGFVAVSHDGEIALPYSTPGMFRGWLEHDGTPTVAVYDDAGPADAI